MNYDEQLEVALHGVEPIVQLRAVVTTWISAGMSQEHVYTLFDRLRERLRHEGREADEDAVMDVMDQIVGWCSPQARLFPSQSTEQS